MFRPLLITIDTEGDNLWAAPHTISTKNSEYLPRFQELCERFGFKPVWLVDYEMALCPMFRQFGQDVLQRGTGEIGMHLHAWNTPPLIPLTQDDFALQPFLTEYPLDLQRQKIAAMTQLLTETFGTPPVSHRAGRWAFDGRYATALIEHGYLVDCSVTPGISWREMKGNPVGDGGPDYCGAPAEPYFISTIDVTMAGESELLEVPMTTRTVHRTPLWEHLSNFCKSVPVSLVRRTAKWGWPSARWLRPNGQNLKEMLGLLDEVEKENGSHAEFMLHSSELMPGGSPRFPTERSIEQLYDDLQAVFEAARGRFRGATLKEFHGEFVETRSHSDE